MILLCGIPSEPPVRLVAEAAESLGIEILMLNQREGARTGLEITVSRAGKALRYHGPGGTRDLGSVTGAYVRLMDYHSLPEYSNSAAAVSHDRVRIEAWHAMLNDWLETSSCRVMNRLKHSNSNMSKPYQAQLIARAGLRTPLTLITNQPDRVRAFQREHGRIIFKSISAHRSIVRELTVASASRLDRIRMLPTQFQELIDGDDVRVHIVESEVFATRIRSDVVDYRYAADEGGTTLYEPTELPEDIATKCRSLSRALYLPLCGIDLKLTKTGEYVCLEVNPSPAYSCFEEQTGQPIAKAIVHSLAYD
jgi:glutathione synthase/RimK-type ligase-like ATP-grasp enzyme